MLSCRITVFNLQHLQSLKSWHAQNYDLLSLFLSVCLCICFYFKAQHCQKKKVSIWRWNKKFMACVYEILIFFVSFLFFFRLFITRGQQLFFSSSIFIISSKFNQRMYSYSKKNLYLWIKMRFFLAALFLFFVCHELNVLINCELAAWCVIFQDWHTYI